MSNLTHSTISLDFLKTRRVECTLSAHSSHSEQSSTTPSWGGCFSQGFAPAPCTRFVLAMGKPISPRKRKYLNGLVNGKTKQQAALDAGYSPSTALSAKAHIETPEVRAAFAELVRERIPARRIAERISEGLDAMKTEFFQKDGVVVETRDVIAWSERRMYAELAAEYGEYHTPQVNVTGNITHKL